MVVLLPKMAMVSDCDRVGSAGIAAVCKETKRRLRQARLHYIQCLQLISIHYSSVSNSISWFNLTAFSSFSAVSSSRCLSVRGFPLFVTK